MKIVDITTNGDCCHWGFFELYPESERRLRELLDSGEDFMTKYGGSKHELMSMRVIRENGQVRVYVSCWMDDVDDLIYDAMTSEQTQRVTDDQIDQIMELWWNSDCTTEIGWYKDLDENNDSYEDVLSAACNLADELFERLHEYFECMKSFVVDVMG